MSSLQDFLRNTEHYKDTIVQREFKSKKHIVGLVTFEGKIRVFKRYEPSTKQDMQREYLILSSQPHNVPMPSVYTKDNDNLLLVLQYIPGENLCDLVNSPTVSINEKQRLIKLLAHWFISFHTSLRDEKGYTIRGDPHLRNFLFTDKIWGLDFEESGLGKPEDDIGGLCASILTTDPMFTNEKFHLSQLFIREYERKNNRNLVDINRCIGVALDEISIQRQTQKDILKRYRKEIVTKHIFLQSSLQ